LGDYPPFVANNCLSKSRNQIAEGSSAFAIKALLKELLSVAVNGCLMEKFSGRGFQYDTIREDYDRAADGIEVEF